MLRTCPRLRKGVELLFWILQKFMQITFFSANVHQCFISCASLFIFKLLLNSFLLARVTANSIFKSVLCFRMDCANGK